MKVIKTTVETVNPATAAKYLERNKNNRPLRNGTVKKYAALMVDGQWELNGEAIKFAESGELLDGQHRLHAVVGSGVAAPFLVVRGVPDRVFDTLDTGAKRTAGDILSLEGFMNSALVASAARILMGFENTGGFNQHRHGAVIYSNRDILEFVEACPAITDSAAYIKGRNKSYRLLAGNGAPLVVLHYLFNRADHQRCSMFFDMLATGANLAEGHPVLVLRNKMSGITFRSLRNTSEGFAIYIKAWNAFCAGKTIRNLYFKDSETMPLVRGL